MAKELSLLLNRVDIPLIIMEYDTTFDLGNFYVSWLTFRHTEFEDLPNNPMPTMGLACLIHNKKMQSSHDYFWSMIKEAIPSIATAKNVVICTDQEAAIVNSLQIVSTCYLNIPFSYSIFVYEDKFDFVMLQRSEKLVQ